MKKSESHKNCDTIHMFLFSYGQIVGYVLCQKACFSIAPAALRLILLRITAFSSLFHGSAAFVPPIIGPQREVISSNLSKILLYTVFKQFNILALNIGTLSPYSSSLLALLQFFDLN